MCLGGQQRKAQYPVSLPPTGKTLMGCMASVCLVLTWLLWLFREWMADLFWHKMYALKTLFLYMFFISQSSWFNKGKKILYGNISKVLFHSFIIWAFGLNFIHPCLHSSGNYQVISEICCRYLAFKYKYNAFFMFYLM